MTFAKGLKRYTLDLFLEEANRIVKKEKRKAYCHILIAYPRIFDALPSILQRYSGRKRSHWSTIEMSLTEEEDMYIVSFVPKEEEEKPVFFFWKTIKDDKYVTILSFSLGNFREVGRCLDSMVGYVRGLWFAWLGSHFIENFDLFVKKILGEDTRVLASFQTIVEKGEKLPRKMRVYPLPPREYVPLEEIRAITKELYLEKKVITTFSRMRYRIISETKNMNFTISLTDRSKIMFEKGDFVLFVTLLKPLVMEARKILNLLRRRFYVSEEETQLFGKTVRIKSLDLIETLVFRRSRSSLTNWYENITELFSSDIPEAKLMNFTLLTGNPYFLVHVIDVENGSSVYLSATSEELRIAPAESYAKEGTVAKLIELLQTRVDPTIAIS